jgi:hypothetical protein
MKFLVCDPVPLRKLKMVIAFCEQLGSGLSGLLLTVTKWSITFQGFDDGYILKNNDVQHSLKHEPLNECLFVKETMASADAVNSDESWTLLANTCVIGLLLRP